MRDVVSIKRPLEILLGAYALIQTMLLVYLWVNHVSFPLNLEAMEIYILAHVKRVVLGLPIYTAPGGDFIPFVYNPLYYYLSALFVKVFGLNLQSLRVVSIIGSLGVMFFVFLGTRRSTGSTWWGVISAGLFAASYRAMDTYIDTAHADSWLLFMILAGCYLIDLKKSKAVSLLGVMALVVAFWFKQHGALFLIGAVIYLTYREGTFRSWIYWLVALVFSFGLYVYYPVSILGPYFHYYTWEVPRQWSQLDINAVIHILSYVIKNYFLLAVISLFALFRALVHSSKTKLSIWQWMLPVAIMSGAMGALDPENNNNVFIPMATWLIIIGVMGLADILKNQQLPRTVYMAYTIVAVSFAVLFYRPASVIIPKESKVEYQDLKNYLAGLDGPVYAPWIGGALPDGYEFQPSVHWVPIYDIIRAPGVNVYNHPVTRQILKPIATPDGNAYILTNYPLDEDIVIGYLSEYYVLEDDLGDRFSALSTLPRRYNLKWPRYLYKYNPSVIK